MSPRVILSEEKPSNDEVETEEVTPATLEPIEAKQDIPTSGVPHEESSEVERSQSPWTPSYSVSSQGGVLDNPGLADEEAVGITSAPEPPVEEPTAETIPTPEIVTPAEVHTFDVSLPPSETDELLFRSLSLPNQRPPPTFPRGPRPILPPSKVPAPVSSLKPYLRMNLHQPQLSPGMSQLRFRRQNPSLV